MHAAMHGLHARKSSRARTPRAAGSLLVVRYPPAAPTSNLMMRVFTALWALSLPAKVGSSLQHLTMFDYDPAAQHSWATLGKTDNVTLLDEGWAKYR